MKVPHSERTRHLILHRGPPRVVPLRNNIALARDVACVDEDPLITRLFEDWLADIGGTPFAHDVTLRAAGRRWAHRQCYLLGVDHILRAAGTTPKAPSKWNSTQPGCPT